MFRPYVDFEIKGCCLDQTLKESSTLNDLPMVHVSKSFSKTVLEGRTILHVQFKYGNFLCKRSGRSPYTLTIDCWCIDQVICGGRGKDRHVYTTVGHTVDVQLHTQLSQTKRRYFILHFKGKLVFLMFSSKKRKT